jgi:hypothetical protein
MSVRRETAMRECDAHIHRMSVLPERLAPPMNSGP